MYVSQNYIMQTMTFTAIVNSDVIVILIIIIIIIIMNY